MTSGITGVRNSAGMARHLQGTHSQGPRAGQKHVASQIRDESPRLPKLERDAAA